MALDKFVLILVVIIGAIWCVIMLLSAVAIYPFGLLILVVYLIVGYIVYRVVRDRMTNKEDDYYEKNVDR